jgi:hypothetical protein
LQYSHAVRAYERDTHIETIAKGSRVHVLDELVAEFGHARWRKMKGMALVRWENGVIRWEEVHWYEAHGKDRVWLKVKIWDED